MDVGSCGSGANNISAQSMVNRQDALDFQKMMNPNTGYAAQQGGGGQMFSGMMQDPTASIGRNGMSHGVNADMDHGGMASGGGNTVSLPKDHSGTDHLMQSGLMMRGDAMQNFELDNADGDYDLSSYISGNRHVVQDVVSRVMEDNEGLATRAADGNIKAMDKLEGKIAKELTNVNDVEDIENDQLREAFVREAKALGLSDEEMDHLLHTPISEVGMGGMIGRNSEISGSLHTVDLDRTRAQDMGNGLYEVNLVSNNGKNNAHDNMDISAFYTEASSAKQAENIVNRAAERGDLDKDGRYNLTDAGLQIMANNLSNYV